MKTSNKLFAAAVALVLGSLASYDAALRAEYRTGHYKDPFYNTTKLDFKDFSAVDVQAASWMSVKITPGPFSVRLENEARQYVKVSQVGGRLNIALVFPDGEKSIGHGTILTITCPQLKQLRTSAVSVVEGKQVIIKKDGYWNGSAVLVQGFTEDSLAVQQDYASNIDLVNNQLGYLKADIGVSTGSFSRLTITKDNRIQAADVTMQHQSELQLASKITAPHFRLLGDSVKTTLSGAALGSLAQ